MIQGQSETGGCNHASAYLAFLLFLISSKLGTIPNLHPPPILFGVSQDSPKGLLEVYARVLKNNMTKEEFTTWAKDAEKLRDKALSEYELVQDDDRLWIIAKLKQDLNEK
ncbi:MAG: hypothetical protein IJG56_04090 [Clostridia bacterium]|nr:hypothetical protein [Clostridia bacterium]